MTKAQLQTLRVGDYIADGENYGDIAMNSFGWVAVNWHGVNPRPLPPVVYPLEVFLYLFNDYGLYRGKEQL